MSATTEPEPAIIRMTAAAFQEKMAAARSEGYQDGYNEGIEAAREDDYCRDCGDYH